MTDSFPRTEVELDERLSRPTEGLLRDLAALEGDLLVIGASGKMGPTLARMGRRGLDEVGRTGQRVIAAARFSDPETRKRLAEARVEILFVDLLDPSQVAALPDAPNLIYMAGQKFGTSGRPELTWMMNTVAPAWVAERFRGARIVAFSTGCVYPMVPVDSGGSREEEPLDPPGEYANSCVGRERVFEYYSQTHGTRALLFRLNYAVDLRYGVLVDVARKVLAGEPVDVSMGYVNVIWQGDACAQALRCLHHAGSPAVALNVTGPETISVRALAHRFGRRFGREPRVVGEEAPTALLSSAARAWELFGEPSFPLEQLEEWVAGWLLQGGRLLGKPTHYEQRDGRY